MREAIRQLLVAALDLPDAQVLEPHAATKDTPKPFLIVREGTQDAGAPWSDFSTVLEVWPNVAQTSFLEVDALALQTIQALHGARVSADAEQYLVEYEGTTGPDMQDNDWLVNTRGLRFRVYALGWLNTLTYAPDPVAALQAWTAATWPGQVATDPTTWAPADAKPGVYWRVTQPVAAGQVTNWGAWVEAVLACHVVAPGAVTKLGWIRKVAEALVLQPRIYLEGVEGAQRNPLTILRVTADSEADPMRQGQIRLYVRFGILRTQPEYLAINHAALQGA